MSEAIEAVIARLESASGPDRELDAWLWWHGGALHAAYPETAYYRPEVAVGYVSGRNPRISDEDLTMKDVTPAYGCPEYTASIDAALTLVEDPLGFSLEYRRYGVSNVVIFDRVWGKLCDASADPPALALCIAALRARQSTDQGG